MSGESSEETAIQPVHERLRRWRRRDGIERLRMRIHRAVRLCEEVMYAEASTTSERLKAASILQQCVRTHWKLIEGHELQERVEALEAFIGAQNGHHAS